MTQVEQTHIPEWSVHDRCRKAREDAGLDQAELAARIDVSRATISNYETGYVKAVRPIVLRAWALATAVPFEWLRDGEEVGRPGVEPGSPGLKGRRSAVEPATREHGSKGREPADSMLVAA